MNEHPEPLKIVSALSVIRLRRDDQHRLMVVPAGGDKAHDTAADFPPFPLPQLPLSLHCWLSGLAGEFHRRHHRCLAALLFLDCIQQRWVRPVLPAQACGSDGTAWTLELGNAPVPAPQRRVAGSFQTRGARDLFDAAGSVPHLDGLHIVQAHQGKEWKIYSFLHAEGDTSVVPPEDLMVDDWQQALTEASSRINFD